ncbi:MAG: ketoacyl-ACP synthase III [Steroidobacteraceae bacterium]|nr:ketoacyl-ACP synthase III [Steroidobacteraceae bacterium]
MNAQTRGAAIVGWGKCLPPATLTNADIATFLDTSDEWIISRTGIRERRVSHVPLGELMYVASARALACAGLEGKQIELIVSGTTSYDDQAPNVASGIQRRIGAEGCAAMDVNTACTSFLYSLSTATAMIKSGVVKTALVTGAEVISPFIDWADRNIAVLFGDGAAAVVLQATDGDDGLLAERLGCYGESREILRVHGMGAAYSHQNRILGKTEWQFEGQEIFKKAVHGMAMACGEALAKVGKTADDVDLVVPHQANMRIIEAVAKKAGVPMERVFTNVHRYGNMSAATVPVALCEALEDGRVKPGALLLMPSFGAGLTFTGHVVRWGQRVTPIGTSDVELPPNHQSALEIVQKYRQIGNLRVTAG